MKKQVFIGTMMNFKIFLPVIFIFMLSCSESKYSKLVKTEMAKGVVYDSLFLGQKLGQTQKEFFDKCWKLNNDKLVTNGANSFVEYKLPSKKEGDSKSDITMLFYGIFNDEKVMTGMKLRFSYVGWSLWNKSLQSAELIHAVKDTLIKWYPGNDFIEVPLEKDARNLLVKVDGNRRITIRPLEDDKDVKVQIDDLRYVLNE